MMTHTEEPAIQNSSGRCFYCNSNLVDVMPIETWEQLSEEVFIKVRCSNRQCEAMAWRPAGSHCDKRTLREEKQTVVKGG